jgi:predicted nucleotidyltransferase
MAADVAASSLRLAPDELREVRHILDRLLPANEVWVFGSRATGRARPHSDLDLLIAQPAALSWAQRADLRDAFEASTLPYRVDVVPLADLEPGFAARVFAERQPLPHGMGGLSQPESA